MLEMERIHHVSLAVRDIERAHAFYSEKLKFKQLERPPFNSTGVWYAIGEHQQLHLLEHPAGDTLRERGIDTTDGHFAIWVKSHKATIEWLESQNIPYEARPDSVAGFAQIFILDPDHNIIEFGAPYSS
ncbi:MULTISPECIES: VOC family protein [unclassified Paenibacillus]|uniref:VOC family protein n=1 Tax=Paenibacillus provencensis TaxID=441151 RepID=A0ABW3PVW1_9BACL|nr:MULTISPECIES: VOC family protein [unclassified Paenibacillus]MCM3129807.1 VOC family protein [Paenibacillus sp. MER 78]SFS91832.1 Catechol 2,3-dioxygenase [Paenibacillus sp. 453mf]